MRRGRRVKCGPGPARAGGPRTPRGERVHSGSARAARRHCWEVRSRAPPRAGATPRPQTPPTLESPPGSDLSSLPRVASRQKHITLARKPFRLGPISSSSGSFESLGFGASNHLPPCTPRGPAGSEGRTAHPGAPPFLSLLPCSCCSPPLKALGLVAAMNPRLFPRVFSLQPPCAATHSDT